MFLEWKALPENGLGAVSERRCRKITGKDTCNALEACVE
jgi:hypothetical protein